jgi:DNA polymerase-1
MAQRLFLLDGMALVYRAHFAFAGRPIRTSAGLNTSALYGFTQTLLDIVQKGAPTHMAVAFDTDAPTPRHQVFPEYKAQREVMPEELSAALPHVRRMIKAFQIPVICVDGFEADDLIGTLVKRAEKLGFQSYMVTADKDFGQLVTEHTHLWRPGRQGSEVEILAPDGVCARWGISRPELVTDMLGLMGDTSDNIPGVPGVGEKTAARLLAQYGSMEEVLAHASEIKGKIGQALCAHRDKAILSKQLATIITDAPVKLELEDLAIVPRDDEAIRGLCIEFEFNALGRRLFGDAFKAGRGFTGEAGRSAPTSARAAGGPESTPSDLQQRDLFATAGKKNIGRSRQKAEAPPPESSSPAAGPTPAHPNLRTISEVPHEYRVARTPAERRSAIEELSRQDAFGLKVETEGRDPKTAKLRGIGFSHRPGQGWCIPIDPGDAGPMDTPARSGTPTVDSGARPAGGALRDLAELLANPRILKVGHNLKFDMLVLRWYGVELQGPFFDTTIAHALIDPEVRHTLDYLSEALLGYTPMLIEGHARAENSGTDGVEFSFDRLAMHAVEAADLAGQLRERLLPQLREHGQERVFFEVEMPVLPALAAMEYEGIRVDAAALADFSRSLAMESAAAEADVHRIAGREFNVNSNRQLGEVLFEQLRLSEKPRKTPTGQYATDEQTLQTLGDHPIVRRLLDYRTVAKLKSTYADALPGAIFHPTGRVHTTFHQAATATGRLSSMDPNLQNIPIRTDRGQEIRRAFVAREGWRLLSADYSQIELRIIAALSREDALIEAFHRREDIHTSTAARVFAVDLKAVTPEMRRRAKMVNFGIAYGISSFGLAQRLGIPRGEAAQIIQQYFASYPRIRQYMDDTITFARAKGYAETATGRRRPIRDINSANATLRSAAERNAINAPIQGTAADMIKIAMARIHQEIAARGLRSRLLLQVHDELVFDLYPPEEPVLGPVVEEIMRTALPLPGNVPIVVELGTGKHWLQAH